MKYFILFLFFSFSSNFLSAQEALESFINIETKKVDNLLVKKGENYKLTTLQKGELYSLFTKKFSRREQIINQKSSKAETSELMEKLDSEFNPKVAELLSVDQRIAYQSAYQKTKK